MPNCHTIDPLVTPYIDGELPDADRRAVDEHVRACAPCHSRFLAERAVRELIHTRTTALQTLRAPDALRARCADAARRPAASNAAFARASATPPASASASVSRRLAPFALAASLVVVVGGAFLYQATEKSARLLAAELTADHVKCFALNGVLRTHQAASTVESSMLSGFDWRLHLPDDPAKAGLELVGSRPCVYAEGQIAHIMYRHAGKPVSLFMLPKSARTEQLVEVLGHEAAIWCVGSRTFVLISREPRQDVERMASFVRASIHE